MATKLFLSVLFSHYKTVNKSGTIDGLTISGHNNKTGGRTMKRTAKTLTILSLLLAVTCSLGAQKTFLVHDIHPLLAQVAAYASDVVLSAEHSAHSYEFYMEEKLELESWMITPGNWTGMKGTGFSSAPEAQKDASIPVEDWMFTPFRGDLPGMDYIFMEVPEEPLQVKSWMICLDDWCKNAGESKNSYLW
jgi:hypothetical protein